GGRAGPRAHSPPAWAAPAGPPALYPRLGWVPPRSWANPPPPARGAPQLPATAAPRGLGGAFVAEWRRVLALRGAFILLVVAPLLYGIYFPPPSPTQIPRQIPILGVASDQTQLRPSLRRTLRA